MTWMTCSGFFLLFHVVPCVMADWPMPGHDPQRTAYDPSVRTVTARNVLWYKELDGFIPSKAQVITKNGNGGRPNLVLVPTSEGLHAFVAATGTEYWFYPTTMPVGNSPTIHDGVVYFGVFDKTIHAVDLETGNPIWQTKEAGAGYDTNPLVAQNMVYAGNRDGYFYAFDASDGSLAWHHRTDARISYSAAIDTDNKTLYFASNDAHAYALVAHTGELLWKSAKLPGDGFYSWWPLVVGDHVIFTGTNNFPQGQLVQYDKEAFPPDPVWPVYPGGSIDADGWMNAQQFLDYFASHPERRTVHVLDKSTGDRTMEAPFLWNGNPDGCRTPLALGPDGLIYGVNHYVAGKWWLQGKVTAWRVGTPMIRQVMTNLDSADETAAIAMIGDGFTYHHKEEQGAYFVRLSDLQEIFLWSAYNANKNLHNVLAPGYEDNWQARKYGSHHPLKHIRGTHGNVNPLVPIGSKLVTHASNSVICLAP